jgi:MoxR-like ATPase
MEERQVTVDGTTYMLQTPFLVLATQNPIEYEGTFPLPEAQLDRFLMKIHLGYPAPSDEIQMLDSQQYRHPLADLQQVVSVEDLTAAQEAIKKVYVSPEVKKYIIDIVTATRNQPEIYLGASPRGALALYRVAQARAAMVGRDHVIPDDVKALAEAVLAHRVIVGPQARIKDITANRLIQNLLNVIPVPGATVGMRSLNTQP